VSHNHNEEAVKCLDEDERLFSSIGRFVFEFSQLEYAIRDLTAQIARIDARFFEAVMTHDFALLCKAAENVFSVELPGQTKDFKKFFSACHALNEDRVRIVHGLWVPTVEGAKLYHVSRSKLQLVAHFDDPFEVARAADRANELRFTLERLVWQMPSLEL